MSDCKHEKLVEGYYGHDCAACGELVYPYGSAPWDDYDIDDFEDDDEEWFDCGWVRGIGCQLAGSESCDFECPFRDNNYRGLALTRARLAKRAARKEQTNGK